MCFFFFFFLLVNSLVFCLFFSSRRRHTRSYGDWSSDVCSSDLRVHINRKDYAQALEWLQKAVALNPDHLRAVQNLGWTLNELGRRDEALAIYQRALALDPDDAWTHANIGWALLKLGR